MTAATRSRSLVRVAAFSLLLCATAAAGDRGESAPSETRPAPPPPFALAQGAKLVDDAPRVHFDRPEGTAPEAPLWARGEHWKMRFDRDGARYHASFGAHLPSTELGLSPDRVTVGGELLEFERAPAVRRAGERVELERGSFVEAYELRPEGVEQLFVFERLPRAGELALHIPLDAGVTPSERADGLALATDAGEIRYSRAVAIDARGRRFDAPTTTDAAGIVIRVDAEALAAAELPLVIDPYLGQTWLETTTTDADEPDAVFDTFNLVWLATFQEAFSATDNDVRVKVLSTAGVVLLDGYADFSANSWSRPRIAYLNSDNRCLVVAEVGVSPSRTVNGRTVRPNGLLLELGTQFQISGNDAGEKYAPTVGGDPFPSQPSNFCVAYQHRFGSMHGTSNLGYALVSPSGLVVFGPTYVPSVPDPHDAQPSLSKSNSAARWTLAFRSDGIQTPDIRGVYIEWDGTLSSIFGIASSFTGHEFAPSASSPLLDTGRSAVAYERRATSGGQADVFVALIEDGVVLNSVNLIALEGSGTQAQDQQRPSVDSDGLHFFVAYSEFVPAFGYYELIGSDLFVTEGALGVAQAHQELFHLGLSHLLPRVAAARREALGPNTFMIVTEVTGDISAARWSSVQGGSWSAYCPGDGTGTPCPCANNGSAGHGCANSDSAAGAHLVLSGAVSTLADSAVLQATFLPAGQTCLFFQGTTEVSNTTFGDGLRCAGGSVVRLGVKTAVDGAASFPGPSDPDLSVAGSIPSLGATRTYQAWYRDPSIFCSTAAFNLSNGVRIYWAP